MPPADIEKANATFQTAIDRSTGDAPAVKKLLVDFLSPGEHEQEKQNVEG